MKTKALPWTVLGIAIVVLLITRQRRENSQLRESAAQLADTNQELQLQLDSLRRDLQRSAQTNAELRQHLLSNPQLTQASSETAPKTTALQARTTERAPEADVISLSKAHLRSLRFEAVNDRFELSGSAQDLLQIDAGEATRLQAVLGELRQQIHAHDLAVIQPIQPIQDAERDPDIARFFQNKTGAKTAYRIPAFPLEEGNELRRRFAESTAEVLGEERSQILLENSRRFLDAWIGGGKDKVLAFIDREGAPGAGDEHEWMIKFDTPSFHGTRSSDPGNSVVPPEFSYLFEVAQQHGKAE